MNEEKARHTVWLSQAAWEKVKLNYRADNCATQNEYIEKAIQFYSGYRAAQSADAYLPEVVVEVMEGKFLAFGDRLGKLLFKGFVEEASMANIIASDTDIDLTTLERLRVKCVKDLSLTHGEIDFGDVLRFQKRLL